MRIHEAVMATRPTSTMCHSPWPSNQLLSSGDRGKGGRNKRRLLAFMKTRRVSRHDNSRNA